jgi:hypothetical protein
MFQCVVQTVWWDTFFFFFAPQYLYLHIIFCTSITPVLMLNCNYFTTMVYLLPCLSNLTTFTHTVYTFFYCVIDCTFVYPMCNSVLFVSHCFALSWPGRSCKWELALNWRTWLNKGEMKNSSNCRDITKCFQNTTTVQLCWLLQCFYYVAKNICRMLQEHYKNTFEHISLGCGDIVGTWQEICSQNTQTVQWCWTFHYVIGVVWDIARIFLWYWRLHRTFPKCCTLF